MLEESNTHYLVDTPDSTVLGVTPGYGRVILLMNLLPPVDMTEPDDIEEGLLACMGIVLTHEMAHTFGMEDRYDDGVHADEGYQCVMESYHDEEDFLTDFYNDILQGKVNAFCDDCARILSGIIYY